MATRDTERSLRIGLMGTRGVPARYGGFETAVEEIGRRLAECGHEVTVYCRHTDADEGSGPGRTYLGMQRVVLPAVRAKALETLSHTALSVVRSSTRRREDAVVLFNAANAAFLPVLRARGVPVAVHVDGLEWQRTKWSGAGQRFYRASEALSVRWADALIADAGGIADYYRAEFGASTELISYGAPIQQTPGQDRLGELGLEADRFHLVVARFEPENHLAEILASYHTSGAAMPLVVVGSAPYSDDYTEALGRIAADDPRIRMLGPVWDQELLDQLYAHARLYLHGHSVGGTNPSLLRAMGAGTAVAAWDVVFNREVMDDLGWYLGAARDVDPVIAAVEADPGVAHQVGDALRSRAERTYDWDDVARSYESLARRLADGWSRCGEVSGRRRGTARVRPATATRAASLPGGAPQVAS